jgi:putative membrane protein
MTAVAPPPQPAAPERHGWHIPTWAAITGGVLLLVIAALGVLRAIRLHRGDRVRRFGGIGRGFGDAGNGHVHWVLWIVVILALVGGIALLVAASRHRRAASAAAAFAAPASTTPTPPAAVGAEQILADRFARGEIDEAEFVARRNALRN